MGNAEVKTAFRQAIADLSSKTQPIEPNNDEFWQQFWQEDPPLTIHDVFALITPADVRSLRECSPRNFVTFCFKLMQQIEHVCYRSSTACALLMASPASGSNASIESNKSRIVVMNCVRLLTRLLPFVFEDDSFRCLLWNSSAAGAEAKTAETTDADTNDEYAAATQAAPPAAAVMLMNCLTDLLFCPNLTVAPLSSSQASKSSKSTSYFRRSKPKPEANGSILADVSGGGGGDCEDLACIDSCEHIWEKGIGCVYTRPQSATYDTNRAEILRLILTCASEVLYVRGGGAGDNGWIQHWTSSENRHALPLFTSLLNVIFAYDPAGGSMANQLLFREDCREPLVEVALQILIVALEDNTSHRRNLFVNYLSRIHRDEDLYFLLSGFKRLLQNPLQSSYLPLPSATRRRRQVKCHQELLVLLWKLLHINKRFLHFMLKSSEVLNVIVPVLYHVCDARQDAARMGLVHVCVFLLLLLSGERNFGVRLNKPYNTSSARGSAAASVALDSHGGGSLSSADSGHPLVVPMDIPLFSGNHGDLLLIVFHRVITTGHSKIQNLFDSLLTIIVNISPYLKSLCMCAAQKLLHLFEAFSTPWFLFVNATNHHLVFYLLEVFNNIIQYQFDGNANLVYCMIRKRQLFHQLANLSTTSLTSKSTKILTSVDAAAMRQDSITSTARPAAAAVSTAVAAAALVPTTPVAPATTPSTTTPTSLDFLTATPAAVQMTSTSNAHELSDLRFGGDGDKNGEKIHDEFSAAGNDLSSSISNNNGITTPSPTPPLPADAAEPVLGGERVDAEAVALPSKVPPSSSSEVTKSSLHHLQHADMLNTQQRPHERVMQLQPAMRATCITTAVDDNDTTSSDTSTTSGGGVGVAAHPAPKVDVVPWHASSDWVQSWKSTLPLQTIMRMLQVLVPQVEKICIDSNLTDESDIIKFLKSGTLVGLLPVPHPILIRKYQANEGTNIWFRSYMWGVIYLRNANPPIWFETKVKMFAGAQQTSSSSAVSQQRKS